MRVELVQREEVKNLYLQNLKDFPGILWRFDFKEIQGASCLNTLIFSQSPFVLWHVRFTTVPFTFLSDQGYFHFLDEKLKSNIIETERIELARYSNKAYFAGEIFLDF